MRDRAYQRRRAYAILGLQPGVSLDQVQKQYKVLVKRWHPDQYATDPSGQAVAAERMREVNAAYRVVTEQLTPRPCHPGSESGAGSSSPNRRLSREEIENLVRAIGTEGPMDHFLNTVGRIEGSLQGILAVVLGVVGLVSVSLLMFKSHWAGLLSGLVMILMLAILVLLALDGPSGRRKIRSKP